MSSSTEQLPALRRAGKGRQGPDIPLPAENDLHPLVNEQRARDVWILLIVFRCINALCVRTFFQPDEYFQSLEPAWQMAFGPQSGAWITWEWEHQLRSSLHPALFAIIYYIADKPMELMSFFPQFRALILSVIPNIAQAIFAAAGDYYTWKLSEKIYGIGSNAAWATLLMTVFSPWQWFCSTRTFSNCLETTMTITALYLWPWEVAVDTVHVDSKPDGAKRQATRKKAAIASSIFQTTQSIKNLRVSLILSTAACILRPTNLLIWFCILMPTVTRLFSSSSKVLFSDYIILAREGLVCGSIVFLISGLSDRLYFNSWTFPPYQLLSFNISQDIAVFYGRNDYHYYITQGLPLLLTTYIPFTLIGLFRSTSTTNIQFLLTTTVLVTLTTLSLISHKEVRFIYPLLPLLHILTAPVITSFFYTTATKVTHPPPFPSSPKSETIIVTRRKPLLFLLLALNISIASYTTISHQSGVIAVMRFLRSEYEELALDSRGVLLSSPEANKYELGGGVGKVTNYGDSETFVGFLMPCHSTPWRSQLIYPGLKAWALHCEPPIHLAARTAEREAYRDEGDRFYDDPLEFLKTEINTRERPWPRYIVGFEGIGDVLREYYEGEMGMPGFKVREKWRVYNSHWHDDWRRTGDVVVWEFVDGSKLQQED